MNNRGHHSFLYLWIFMVLYLLHIQCHSGKNIQYSNVECADKIDKEDKKNCLENLRLQMEADLITKGDDPSGMQYAEHSQRVAELGQVDILFVIDNSGSMADEQRAIANQFDSFLDTIKNLNYQIAIITTDENEQGQFRTFGNSGKTILSSGDDHNQNVSLFKQTIHTGTNGNNNEKALHTTTLAINRSENQNIFFREDALLTVIIVSDEPPNHSSTTPADVFTAVKNLNKNLSVMVNAIILPAHNHSSNPYVQTTLPSQELKATFGNIKDGYIGNISKNDYGAQLGPISNLVVRNIPITLPCEPKPPTVAVFINGKKVDSDNIDISEKLVLLNLDEGINRGAQVDIRYVCK